METNEDGSITVILEEVVMVGTKEISAVTIKKPRGKHLRGMDMNKLGEFNNLSKLTVSCSDLASTVEFDELGMSDIFKLFEVVSSFFAQSQEIGKTRSEN